MKRTFRGWLLRYCCELAGMKTTSLKMLSRAACAQAPQAAEAVFLYAVELGRMGDLLAYADGGAVAAEWARLGECAAPYSGDAEALLRAGGEFLPVRYRKVLDAYDGIAAAAANDRRVVAQMAVQVRDALEASGTTRYRLAKDLGLNEGNVYAWLAGDPSKLSRKTARRAWHYARALTP